MFTVAPTANWAGGACAAGVNTTPDRGLLPPYLSRAAPSWTQLVEKPATAHLWKWSNSRWECAFAMTQQLAETNTHALTNTCERTGWNKRKQTTCVQKSFRLAPSCFQTLTLVSQGSFPVICHLKHTNHGPSNMESSLRLWSSVDLPLTSNSEERRSVRKAPARPSRRFAAFPPSPAPYYGLQHKATKTSSRKVWALQVSQDFKIHRAQSAERRSNQMWHEGATGGTGGTGFSSSAQKVPLLPPQLTKTC